MPALAGALQSNSVGIGSRRVRSVQIEKFRPSISGQGCSIAARGKSFPLFSPGVAELGRIGAPFLKTLGKCILPSTTGQDYSVTLAVQMSRMLPEEANIMCLDPFTSLQSRVFILAQNHGGKDIFSTECPQHPVYQCLCSSL